MLILGQVIPGNGLDSQISDTELQARCAAAKAELVKGTLNVRVDSMEQVLHHLGSPDFEIKTQQDYGGKAPMLKGWQIDFFLPSEHGWTIAEGKTFIINHGVERRIYIMSEVHFRTQTRLTDYSMVKLRKITYGLLEFFKDIKNDVLFESHCHATQSNLVGVVYKLNAGNAGDCVQSLGRCDFETPAPDDKHNNTRWWQIELIPKATPGKYVLPGKTFVLRQHFNHGADFLRVVSEIDFRTEPALKDGMVVPLPATFILRRTHLNAD